MKGVAIKRLVFPLALAAVVMLVFPWLSVTLPLGDGFGAFILLFFAVDPLFSLLTGLYSARSRRLYLLPLYVSLLFLVGAWTFFEPWELDFLIYAVAYLAIGYAALLLRLAIKRIFHH